MASEEAGSCVNIQHHHDTINTLHAWRRKLAGENATFCFYDLCIHSTGWPIIPAQLVVMIKKKIG